MQNFSFLGVVQRLSRVVVVGWWGGGGGGEKLEIRLSSAQLQLGLGLSLAKKRNNDDYSGPLTLLPVDLPKVN